MSTLNEFYLTDLQFSGDLVKADNGDIADVTGLANLQQALFHRLITQKGSLIHRPDYGVGIKQYQNAVGSLAVQQKIAANIDAQFRQDFRVQDVTGVSIEQDANNAGLFKIVVKVTTAGFDELPMTFIPFGGS